MGARFHPWPFTQPTKTELMIRLLFLLHRYLGIVVGLVMLIWTVSGIIMMYKVYPELDQWQKLGLLQNLDTDSCCQLPASPAMRSERFSEARIEMLANVPVLRLDSTDRGMLTYSLVDGQRMEPLDQQQAAGLAEDFVARRYPDNRYAFDAQIHNDQWTVYGAYNPLRPLYRYTLDDQAGTQFYLSSQSGEVIQITTREQRVWGYLGAVIHWLYPTVLRQHTVLWTQVVIWLTILGIFLTATGLYIGIRQYRNRSNGRLSPYRGLALYHHYAGLVFGVLTLTWVASGLLSMNPWGTLEGEGMQLEVRRLQERAISWQDIEGVVAQLSDRDVSDYARLQIEVLAGERQVVAHSASGEAVRLASTTLQPQALSRAALADLSRRLLPGSSIESQVLLTESDRYYYDHHELLEFPIYRVVYDDAQNRHYYLSPVNGQLVRKIDSELRLYRWLFYGIHRGDFSAFLRSRPVWDLFMVLFLLGVTLVCGTGSYMAIRRVRRDLALSKYKSESALLYEQSLEEF